MESERDCQSNSTTDLWTTSQRHLVTWPPAVLPCKYHALWWLQNLPPPLLKHTIIWLIHILLRSSLVNLPWWKIKPWGKGFLESPLRCCLFLLVWLIDLVFGFLWDRVSLHCPCWPQILGFKQSSHLNPQVARTASTCHHKGLHFFKKPRQL